MTRPRYIAVEGCIGVGKTTLSRLLSEATQARTVLEVVEENPFLPEFYKDKVAHAFKTQMFFLLSRFKQQEQLMQGDLFSNVVVADYIFDKDRIFAELTLSPSELALYDDIFGALKKRVRTPDLVIYLHAPMDVILERIARRGRSFEKDIDQDYLASIVSGYDRFFAHYELAPVLMVDTAALNFPQRAADFARVTDMIEQFFAGTTDKRMHLSGSGKSQADQQALFA